MGGFDKFSNTAKEALNNFETEDFMIHRPVDDDTVIEIGPFFSVVKSGVEERFHI